MTLGYGQLLKNIKGAVEDTVFSGPSSKKLLDNILNEDNGKLRKALGEKARKNQTPEDVVVEFLT